MADRAPTIVPCYIARPWRNMVTAWCFTTSAVSQRHPESVFSLQIMIDDLDALIQKFRRSPSQKVFLLGHSWGAMLATAYIDSHPGQIAGAVLAEPGGFTWEQTKAYVERSRSISLLAEESNDALYNEQFFTGREDEHEILDYKMQLASAGEVAPGNPVGNAGNYPFWRKGAAVANALFKIAATDGFDFTQHLHLFEPKVLFLYSELNTAYGLPHAQLVSSAYRHVQLQAVQGSGHEMFYFGWNALYPAVLAYFNQLK